MFTSTHLLRRRRFLPLFVTQLFNAFNDNLYKTTMVLFVVYAVYNDESTEATFSGLASGLFILPFFLLSALAGQLADMRDKAAIILVTRSLLLANLVDRCIRIADTRVEDLSITVPGGQGGGQGSPRRMRPRQPNAPAPAKTRIEAAAGPAVQSAEARSVAAPKAPVGQEVSNAAVASGAAQPGSMSNGAMQ